VKLRLDTGLDLPPLPREDRLNTVVGGALNKLGVHASSGAMVWPASFFGLDQVDPFVQAAPDAQARILERCSLQLVEEAWFIERAGMAFSSRMCLEARTLEERQLYACFAADEAAHTAMVRGHLPAGGANAAPSGFHRYLAELIEDAGRSTLIAVVQVALEGWGLTHYRRLAGACPHPGFRAALATILKDEARHHASGVMLCARQDLSGVNGDEAVDFLARMLDMVRAGPVAVMEELDRELGIGSTHPGVLRELQAGRQVRERLALLHCLLRGAVPSELLRRLSDRFEPPAAA